MSRTGKTNVVLGLVVVAFSLLVIFVWVPLDTVTGIMGTVRRRPFIGDSLAPTLAGVFLLMGGLLVAIFERNAKVQASLDPARIRFVMLIVLSLAIGFLVMRYAGPVAVALSNFVTGGDLTYRPLRATVPWKYIGFFLGCAFSVASISALTERRFGARHILIGVCAAILLILIYDVPFEDILLPPNGDL